MAERFSHRVRENSLRVYNVGRSMLSLLVLCLGAAPFYWLIGKYAVGIGAVLGIVFLAVSGAFRERDAQGASNYAMGACGFLSIVAVVSLVTGVLALVRNVGHGWPVVGGAVAALTLVYFLTCVVARVFPRWRTNTERERLASRLGWRHRRADAELLDRVRGLFPEFGDVYGVVDGEIDGVAFTMGTVRRALRPRGRMWLLRLPVALPRIQIKRDPSKAELGKGMLAAGDVGYGYVSPNVDPGQIPLAAQIVAGLRTLDVAECRIRGRELALLVRGAGRPEDEARLVPLAYRALPLEAARQAADEIVAWEAGSAAQHGAAVAGRTAPKDPEPETLFGYGYLAGFVEIICGICAWIYNGFLPGVALLVAAIVFFVVASRGDQEGKKPDVPTAETS
ncbi:hypothetical protein [Actinoallomurus iriomotensis]|uniref:hypothetical protein n=1 Tax=Actinoallomurus iriomotensis TaxID=478107 RepID=UPI0025566908|nr:hypothetical protein [Actinoallomurus iriomotensis]